MNIWLLLLTFLNVILLAGLSLSLFLRLKERKEDRRLTKGLQLLQNKISILEDLSDRTDEQVRKLIHALDSKTNEVKNLLDKSENSQEKLMYFLQALETKSKEISALMLDDTGTSFQQKQNKIKTQQYSTAAQLAQEGASLEQIQSQVELSPAEIQMIIKVHRPQARLNEEFKKTTQSMPQTFTEAVSNETKKIIPFEFKKITGQ